MLIQQTPKLEQEAKQIAHVGANPWLLAAFISKVKPLKREPQRQPRAVMHPGLQQGLGRDVYRAPAEVLEVRARFQCPVDNL